MDGVTGRGSKKNQPKGHHAVSKCFMRDSLLIIAGHHLHGNVSFFEAAPLWYRLY